MKHFATFTFWLALEKLPDGVRRLADKNYALLRENPRHPSLHFKQVDRFWSVRIGRGYRAIGVSEGEDIVWIWIGSHSDYDRMIK